MADFQKALEYVLDNEGGFSNNPADRGGPTNFGITQEVLEAWRKAPTTSDDVKNLTALEAGQIYKFFYWDALKLDQIEDQGSATAIFDTAVNRGLGTCVKYVQRACGIPVDSVMGKNTTEAVNSLARKYFLYNFIFEVQEGYINLVVQKPSQIVFLKGWLNRSLKLIGLL